MLLELLSNMHIFDKLNSRCLDMTSELIWHIGTLVLVSGCPGPVPFVKIKAYLILSYIIKSYLSILHNLVRLCRDGRHLEYVYMESFCVETSIRLSYCVQYSILIIMNVKKEALPHESNFVEKIQPFIPNNGCKSQWGETSSASTSIACNLHCYLPLLKAYFLLHNWVRLEVLLPLWWLVFV